MTMKYILKFYVNVKVSNLSIEKISINTLSGNVKVIKDFGETYWSKVG